MDTGLLILFSLLVIGFLYSSVGHGGASGYIALLSLFGIVPAQYKSLILILNIIVASLAFIQFYRAGFFKWHLCWPFIVASIPFAFLGSKIPIHDDYYNLFLGIALIFPIIRLVGFFPSDKEENKTLPLKAALIIGAIIGFVSGILSIGGGIFLSPVIILFAWGNAKEAAAVSALFIVVNSISGLIGSLDKPILMDESSLSWFVAIVTGGIAGSYLGSHRFQNKTVQYVLAAVLSIACVKLIFLT
ncbi:MAG TPA: sulfite exporter TauE/SafE family protein [Chitinophagaceae bacterium]|jgi:uncharacterized membrane protein YfcA|nr:sulfite exporter TauE/SafE family protein [Chitinophagaceae bacterium]